MRLREVALSSRCFTAEQMRDMRTALRSYLTLPSHLLLANLKHRSQFEHRPRHKDNCAGTNLRCIHVSMLG